MRLPPGVGVLPRSGGDLRRLLRVAGARRCLRRAAAQQRRGHDLNLLRQEATGAVAVLLAETGRAGGPVRGELVAALTQLADLHLAAFDLHAAVTTLDEALQALDGEADRVARCDVLVRRGHVHRLRADHDAALTDLTTAVTVAPDELRRAGALNALGILHKDLGHLDDAESLYGQALRLMTAHLGADSPALASLEHNLAGLAHARGRHDDGLLHIERALALRARTPGGADPADVLSDRTVRLALLAGSGRLPQAEQLAQQLIEQWTQLRGPDHYEVGHVRHHLATVLERLGNQTRAVTQYQAAHRVLHAALGPNHPDTHNATRAVQQLAAGRHPGRTQRSGR